MNTQKGFISIASLIAIIVGLVVVVGGAYYVMQQNAAPQIPIYQPVTTQQNTQPTANTTTQPTPSQNKPALASGMNTYTNSQHGFSVAYPSDLTPATPGQSTSWYSSSQNKGVAAIHFGDPKNMPARAQMQVGFSGDSTDVANCLNLPDRPMQLVTDKGTVTINGVNFKSFTVDDVTSGHHYDEQWYKSVHNGSCWAMGTITQWNSHLSGAEAIRDQNELNQALSKLDAMAKTFRFTN